MILRRDASIRKATRQDILLSSDARYKSGVKSAAVRDLSNSGGWCATARPILTTLSPLVSGEIRPRWRDGHLAEGEGRGMTIIDLQSPEAAQQTKTEIRESDAARRRSQTPLEVGAAVEALHKRMRSARKSVAKTFRGLRERSRRRAGHLPSSISKHASACATARAWRPCRRSPGRPMLRSRMFIG